MIETGTAYHGARKRTFGETDTNIFLRTVEIDRINVVAMRHDRADALLIETQHIRYDGLFALMENTGLRALLHQHVDFIVGDRRFLAPAGAQHLQKQRR